MKTIIISSIGLLLFSLGQLKAADNTTVDQTQSDTQHNQTYKIARSAYASGGIIRSQKFSLTGSIGQHSSSQSANGNWLLIAGLISRQQGWPNDLIYTDTFEFHAPEYTGGIHHE